MTQHRVLVADDDRDTADSLAELLRLDGHHVTCATNGLHALTLYDQISPDIVILDISMPLVDGHEVARRIRRKNAHPRALLLALSGWGRAKDVTQSIAAGFDHHLVKPVDPEEVSRLLSMPPRMPRFRDACSLRTG